MPNPIPPGSKKEYGCLTIIGLVILTSVWRSCEQDRTTQRQTEQAQYRAQYQTIVWVPNPATGGLMPYSDVDILDKGSDSIKFKTTDGQVIEQHGTYRVEERKRY